MSEQANKVGGGNDGDIAVVRGLEILIPGHEVVGLRVRGEQIKEWAIALIADGGVGGNGANHIGVETQISEKRLWRDGSMVEVSADGGALEYVLQFLQRDGTHHRYNLSGSNGVENLRWWTGQRHQPGNEDIGIKNDAHAALERPPLQRQSAPVSGGPTLWRYGAACESSAPVVDGWLCVPVTPK